MNIKKLSLNKPNQLIELVGTPISNLGSLTYNYILHKAQFLKSNKVEISSSEVFKALSMSEDKDELIKVLITLTENRIISKDSKGKIWGVFNLLSQWEEQEGIFSIHLTEKIYETVIDQKDLYYTTIQLIEQKSYKCVYSIIFYEIFKKYEKVNLPIFSIEELKELTGTTLKYDSIYDFKRYVLDKALFEINEKNKKYNYSYTELKIGRKTKEIKFIKTDKNTVDLKKIKNKKESVKPIEPKVKVLERTQLEIEKEKLSLIILNSKLPTRERIILFGELSVIENMKALKKLEKKIIEKL